MIVIMGSGADTADETVSDTSAAAAKVGVLKVRVPSFSVADFVNAIPRA